MRNKAKKSKVVLLVIFLAFFIAVLAFIFKILFTSDTIKETIENETISDQNFNILMDEIALISGDEHPYTINDVKTDEDGFFNSSDLDLKKRYAYDNLEFFYQYDLYKKKVLENKSYLENNFDYVKSLLKDTLLICNSNFKTLINNYNLNIDFIEYPEKKHVFSLFDGGINALDAGEYLHNCDLSKYSKIVFLNDYNKKYFDLESLPDYTCQQISNYIHTKYPDIKTYFLEFTNINDEEFDTIKNLNFLNNLFKDRLKGQFIQLGNLYSKDISIDKTSLDNVLSYLAFYISFIDLKEKEFIAHKHITKDDIKATNNQEIYLTFDDGPSENTIKLLDILKMYNVKASFFVTNQHPGFADNLKKIVSEGHTIGAHTYSHNYSIYRSKETYFEDLYKIQCVIRKETNKFTNLIRFPGGSINSNNSKLHMKEFVEEIQDMGYIYYDWNVSSGDGADINSEKTLSNIILGISKKKQKYIVLMHDTKFNTVSIVEPLINYLNTNGFTILNLKEDSYVCHMVFKE